MEVVRYAIQRALIDQGFAAKPGYLLSSLEFALPFELESDSKESGPSNNSGIAYRRCAPSGTCGTKSGKSSAEVQTAARVVPRSLAARFEETLALSPRTG